MGIGKLISEELFSPQWERLCGFAIHSGQKDTDWRRSEGEEGALLLVA